MKRLLSLLFACLATVAIQAQIMKCHIDGPANVRQHPNTKSAVMGSIKNGMVATVSHVQGNMWKIHSVQSPRGGSAYTGHVVGYYTHRQNLIFDIKDNSRSTHQKNPSHGNSYSWLQGQWRYTSQYGTVNVYITGSKIKVYYGMQLDYNGSYSITQGSGKYAGYTVLKYPGSFIILNSQNQRLYAEDGVAFNKVK